MPPIPRCLAQLTRAFESEYGGFSEAPKFPQPSNFNFLFTYYALNPHLEDAKVRREDEKKDTEGGCEGKGYWSEWRNSAEMMIGRMGWEEMEAREKVQKDEMDGERRNKGEERKKFRSKEKDRWKRWL